jgi:hypothetical protein
MKKLFVCMLIGMIGTVIYLYLPSNSVNNCDVKYSISPGVSFKDFKNFKQYESKRNDVETYSTENSVEIQEVSTEQNSIQTVFAETTHNSFQVNNISSTNYSHQKKFDNNSGINNFMLFPNKHKLNSNENSSTQFSENNGLVSLLDENISLQNSSDVNRQNCNDDWWDWWHHDCDPKPQVPLSDENIDSIIFMVFLLSAFIWFKFKIKSKS